MAAVVVVVITIQPQGRFTNPSHLLIEAAPLALFIIGFSKYISAQVSAIGSPSYIALLLLLLLLLLQLQLKPQSQLEPKSKLKSKSLFIHCISYTVNSIQALQHKQTKRLKNNLFIVALNSKQGINNRLASKKRSNNTPYSLKLFKKLKRLYRPKRLMKKRLYNKLIYSRNKYSIY